MWTEVVKAMADALGFSYHLRKSGELQILRQGREVGLLRGAQAAALLAKLRSATGDEAQQLMAKATGNYKRGNEGSARQHPRSGG